MGQQEIRLMKQRVKEMEEEAAKLRELQAAAEAEAAGADGNEASAAPGAEGGGMETEDDRAAADTRSIYVGNVRCGISPCLAARSLNDARFHVGRLCRDS
jgi:polyadenylate-binding protein 2